MKIILTQPNYAWFNKRAWEMHPYTLALLNACLKNKYDVQLFDPNYNNLSEKEVLDYFKNTHADIVGVSSISTEYVRASQAMNAIIKKALPNSIVINGGIIPTVMPELAMKDPNVDYWIMGEGEFRFPQLLNELSKPNPDLYSIDGLAFWNENKIIINQSKGFIENLDSIPFADYGNLNLIDYGNKALKYSAGLLPRKFPYAVTISSRGCPYLCTFCAASTVSGRKIRFRSAKNVLDEIDMLYKAGIREIIFLDDHFLGNRKRAIQIIQGMIENKYDLTWKCANLTIFLLDREILELMKESGCYQVTLSIESGNQYVLNNIIKKPVKLEKMPEILEMAKSVGFEIITNFVIGFPGETWEQIRQTFRFAESIDADLVNFHIATPLPKTELMDICLRDGYLPKDFDIEKNLTSGYSKGMICSNEFTSNELEILRAYEWDRINFSTPERKKTISRMEGISIEELEKWRVETRRKVGVNVVK
jgi:radical SAM superfamily enzyme YgiQ (UPF0313 family)